MCIYLCYHPGVRGDGLQDIGSGTTKVARHWNESWIPIGHCWRVSHIHRVYEAALYYCDLSPTEQIEAYSHAPYSCAVTSPHARSSMRVESRARFDLSDVFYLVQGTLVPRLIGDGIASGSLAELLPALGVSQVGIWVQERP